MDYQAVGDPGITPTTEFVVEPTQSASGGVNWIIRKDGFTSGRHNYKDDAVKEARKRARKAGGRLTILNKQMNIQDQHEY